jgi:hypothetical protein
MSKSASAKRYWRTYNQTPTTGRFHSHGPYPADGLSIPSSFPGANLNHNLILPQRSWATPSQPASPVVNVNEVLAP